MSAPPPPPPHGGVPKGSGLPPGKYDIFVIPEHSAGSGFLYLPSLQPNVNSFAAGFASALILVALFQSMAPAFRAWWDQFQGMGNTGILLIIAGVGFGAWALGRTQQDSSKQPPPGGHPGHGEGAGYNTHASGATPGPDPNAAPPPPPPPPHNEQPKPQPPPPQQEKPKPSWQRQTPPQPGAAKAESAKGSWEKAREEMRKREEERKAKEAEQKRREEAAKRLAELRAKEARERQEREAKREKEAKEAQAMKDAEKRLAEIKAAAERKAAELKAAELKAAALKAAELKAAELKAAELKAAELKAAELKAAEEKKKQEEQAAQSSRKGSSYAFSGVGERTSMWPNGRPPVPTHSPAKTPASPNAKPPAPTAKTYLSTDDDQYSFRPYDQPKKSRHKPSISSFSGSEASWAASQTTAKTTPPGSFRGPYSTKDPDKIVISGVYLFASQFAKEPASQLLSGVGPVTDGLILRITTEGLFIDDDVRGVPQREWDVKAWTLKQVEVWCPPHCLTPSSATPSLAHPKAAPNLLHKMAGSKGVPRSQAGSPRLLTGDEADLYLAEMLRACKDCCRLGLCDEHKLSRIANTVLPAGQTGEWKTKGLHVLRATVRDQDGKRYLFVVEDAESWKLAVGLQRLRRGTQVRQLGVSGMSATDAKGTLEMLGYH
ncbi:hypothetical protein NLU13_2591 [Sarocladium strictum]|uniref:Trans-sialidase-like protein n=1 Tax=Sarocladium strictum TaxID=5046 RepID=A0AA39L9P1_SARSR|nr:hypothetical protein NLU13_2591 [Sarocladium strictum]